MAEPFLSEIRMVSFPFAPKGWALANGQTLPINQNQALFSLLGTTFGGNGQTTFALPNYMSRVPMHVGNRHVLGESAGEPAHTLTANELPRHSHTVQAVDTGSATANVNTPVNNFFSNSQPGNLYQNSGGSIVALKDGAISNTGGSQAHQNMQPYLTINFCVALQGIFPSRN